MEVICIETQHTELGEEEHIQDKCRKVRWSEALEQVRYFVPLPQHTESRWKRKIKHLKEKALDLKQKPLVLFWDLYESDTAHTFQNGLKSLARKINGRSDCIDFEDIYDMNKQWDELFELYTARREISQVDEIENLQPKKRSQSTPNLKEHPVT